MIMKIVMLDFVHRSLLRIKRCELEEEKVDMLGALYATLKFNPSIEALVEEQLKELPKFPVFYACKLPELASTTAQILPNYLPLSEEEVLELHIPVEEHVMDIEECPNMIVFTRDSEVPSRKEEKASKVALSSFGTKSLAPKTRADHSKPPRSEDLAEDKIMDDSLARQTILAQPQSSVVPLGAGDVNISDAKAELPADLPQIEIASTSPITSTATGWTAEDQETLDAEMAQFYEDLERYRVINKPKRYNYRALVDSTKKMSAAKAPTITSQGKHQVVFLSTFDFRCLSEEAGKFYENEDFSIYHQVANNNAARLEWVFDKKAIIGQETFLFLCQVFLWEKHGNGAFDIFEFS